MKTKRLFSGLSNKWDWLQVEVSSHCHAACVYCPTAIYPKGKGNRLMSMETYQKLIPAFSRTRLVYLQGWGEPFMNPLFFEMACMAKAAGCRVGMTTNGMLLNDHKLTEIVNSCLDIVTFSLAGCSKTNDVFRKGTRLAQVLKVIRQLKEIKEQKGVTHPEIHVAYMLLRSGLDEIEQLPGLLAGLGVSQVVISTLDFVPSPALECEALIPSSQEEYASIQARLEGLVGAGKTSGLDIRYQLARFQDKGIENGASNPGKLEVFMALPVARPACTENIQHAAFISAGGDVSPCVFTCLPVGSPEVAAAQTGRPYQFMTFGNIGDQSLEDIWHSRAYRAFRYSHRAYRLLDTCHGCLKPRIQGF
jgi:MoaA/NifB/PqqE/SkfB family radical SAM enzyme